MLSEYRWVVEIVVGLLTSSVGWLVGRRQRNNVFLSELQSSIDSLAAKNAEQMNEILKLREQVVELRTENLTQSKELVQVREENRMLNEQITALRKDNRELNAKVSALTEQLSGVKTITRTK